jgi:hypothetical protein
MDETYIKVNREWVYLYCAVDKHGPTVDFRLSKHRDSRLRSSSFAKHSATIGRLASSYFMRIGQRIAPCGCFGANIRLGAVPECAPASMR